MKKLIYILFVIIFSFSFSSCKKTEYHKVMFEITFLGSPNTGSSNFIDIGVVPNYPNTKPFVDRFNVPQVWRYEYLGLEKGQKVYFSVYAQLSYYFEMRVYIDGVEKSYRRVKVSDNTYYACQIEESYGLNDKSTSNRAVIEFTY